MTYGSNCPAPGWLTAPTSDIFSIFPPAARTAIANAGWNLDGRPDTARADRVRRRITRA
jgi:hypothetical protein